MDGPTRNQETLGVSKGTPLQSAEEAKHKGHRISFKSFKELLCNIPFLGGLFKRLFNRRVKVLDPNRETGTLPCETTQEGNPQPLIDALLGLEPDHSNETLIEEKNKA